MPFPMWHWAVVLLIIGVSAFLAVRSERKPAQSRSDLVGFGGWLLLLAIVQALSPLRTLAEFGASIEGYRRLMAHPNGAFAAYGEIALALAFLALQLVVFVAMLRRSPSFKLLFVIQWVAIPVGFAADLAWISASFEAPMNELLAGDALVTPMVSFVVTGIWVAYVFRSVRVRNTFDGAAANARIATAFQKWI